MKITVITTIVYLRTVSKMLEPKL